METPSSGFYRTNYFYISAFISIIYGYMESESPNSEWTSQNYITQKRGEDQDIEDKEELEIELMKRESSIKIKQ